MRQGLFGAGSSVRNSESGNGKLIASSFYWAANREADRPKPQEKL